MALRRADIVALVVEEEKNSESGAKRAERNDRDFVKRREMPPI